MDQLSGTPHTLSERWGRLFISCQLAIRTNVVSNRAPSKPDVRVGVDLGLRSLATIADSDGDIKVFPNPTPLRATLTERRRVGRNLSRRIPGSRGHKRAKAKLAQLDRKAVHIRRESIHQLTRYLVDSYGEVKIEDLNIAAMSRSMGRRTFRRSVSDAGLGGFRPILTYKADRVGAKVVVVDRFFPSSQSWNSTLTDSTASRYCLKSPVSATFLVGLPSSRRTLPPVRSATF